MHEWVAATWHLKKWNFAKSLGTTWHAKNIPSLYLFFSKYIQTNLMLTDGAGAMIGKPTDNDFSCPAFDNQYGQKKTAAESHESQCMWKDLDSECIFG